MNLVKDWQGTNKHFRALAEQTPEVKEYDGRDSSLAVCSKASELMAKEICSLESELSRTKHHRNRLDEALRFAIEHQLDTSPHEISQRIKQILSDV